MSSPGLHMIKNRFFKMADRFKYEAMEIPESDIIDISSDSNEENSEYSPVNTEKEESPDPPTTLKPSIIPPTIHSNKRKSSNSVKKKGKRIPCPVCSGRFGTQVTLDMHMKRHWTVFDKMEKLLEHITDRMKNKVSTNADCKCSRCAYESRDNVKPYEVTNNFCCHVCDLSFLTANKLSKHMDKHREAYFKMKKLEEEKHILFFKRPIIKVEDYVSVQ